MEFSMDQTYMYFEQHYADGEAIPDGVQGDVRELRAFERRVKQLPRDADVRCRRVDGADLAIDALEIVLDHSTFLNMYKLEILEHYFPGCAQDPDFLAFNNAPFEGTADAGDAGAAGAKVAGSPSAS